MEKNKSYLSQMQDIFKNTAPPEQYKKQSWFNNRKFSLQSKTPQKKKSMDHDE